MFIPYMDTLYPKDAGAVLDLRAAKANGNVAGINSPLTNPWKDLSGASTVYNYSNMVTNSDFSNGTTGWVPSATTISVASNELTMTATAQYGNVNQSQTVTSGSKYYLRALVKATSNLVQIRLYDGVSTTSKTHTGGGTYEPLSLIRTMAATYTGNVVKMVDDRASAWTASYFKEIIMIDLTALGLENISLSEADTLFAYTATSNNATRANDVTLTNFAGTISDGYAPQPILSRIGAGKQFVNLLGAIGNFPSTTGWGADFGSISVSNNIATVTCNGGASFSRATANTGATMAIGDKLYVYTKFRVTNSSCTSVQLIKRKGSGGTQEVVATITNPTINTDYYIADVRTLTEATTADLTVYIQHNYADAATANGKVMEIQLAHTFNCTSIFGLGSELVKLNMDVIIQQALRYYGYINNQILQIAYMDFLKTDGSDSYGAMANTASMDIVGDFAFCTAFIIPSGAGTGYFISKSLDNYASIQYAIFWDSSTKLINVALNGSGRISSSIKVETNQLIKLEIARISGVLKVIINDVVVSTASYTTTLTSAKPNLMLFATSANAGGTTRSNYLNLYLAYMTLLSNPKSDSNVAKITKELCKNYQP